MQDPFKAEDEQIQRKLGEMLILQQETTGIQPNLSSSTDNDTEHSQEESPTREAKERMESKKSLKDKRKGDHPEGEPLKKKAKGKGKARAD